MTYKRGKKKKKRPNAEFVGVIVCLFVWTDLIALGENGWVSLGLYKIIAEYHIVT